ncbi:MAG: flagellar hook-associated protein FlgK [Hyphomonadaceae bacterium]
MSIASIMSTGLSALAANQQALKITSGNVANVNTEGYSRLEVQMKSRSSTNGMAGVEIDVRRVANSFLIAAEMRSASDVAAAGALADFMDRAQSLLGDPSESGSVFSTLDTVFSSFGALSVDPSSELRRSTSISELETMLSQISSTQSEIMALRNEANTRAQSLMEEANSLMSGIARLNTSIQRAKVGGTSAPDAETEQQRMLDRLSEILDIRVQERSLGGVEVRTEDGLLLVDLEAGRLSFDSTSQGEAYPGVVLVMPHASNEIAIDTHVSAGELKGVLRARDRDLVDLSLSFAEFGAGVVEALNEAHNAGSPVPASQTLTGRNTGLLSSDGLNFTGVANLAIVDADGVVQHNYTIDFDNGVITDDTGAVNEAIANDGVLGYPTIGTMVTALQTAVGGNATVDFTNGVMTISGATAADRIVVADAASPNAADRAGRGFSNTFGLNDLITKAAPTNYATGLTDNDLHGFSAGTISFGVRNTDGALVRSIDVTVTAGTTMQDLQNQINTALAGFGQADLDENGRLMITSASSNVIRLDVLSDTTLRGGSGLSMSEFFGLGETIPTERALNLSVRSSIRSNPGLLTTAQADLSGALAGDRVLSSGDGSGALALEAAGSKMRYFSDAGGLIGQVTSVNDYAARLAGHAALRSEALDSAKSAAEAVRDEVKLRRSSEEGVNLDEELVNMTTYQQAYAAASRLIQAARDMYDILLQLT